MTDLGHGQAAYRHFAEHVRTAAGIGTCIKTKGNQMNNQFDSRIQTILDDHVKRGVVGVSLALSLPGEEMLLYQSGLADRLRNMPMTADHLFRIASWVVSRNWWKFSGGVLRTCGFGPDRTARSRLIGAMG